MGRPNNSLLLKKDYSEFGQIHSIALSFYVLSQDVIIIGFDEKILLCQLEISDEVNIEVKYEIQTTFRCSYLSISPETTLSILPNIIVFAGAENSRIHVFKSNANEIDCKKLDAHLDHVNDIKFDFDNNFLVSVSDDCTAKLWSTDEFSEVATFQLTSPGMSACWHREDPLRLLIAEKCGLIRFYNVETQTPILSLDHGKPLSKCDWAPFDAQLIASLQLGELVVWNLMKPCVPVGHNLLFTELGGDIKFSPFGELVAAVNQLDGHLKVVHSQNQQLKLAVPVMLPSNLAWHCRLPMVCIGDNMNLYIWSVGSK